MDNRPPPPPPPSYSRPQERPLIHNPNHAGQAPPPPQSQSSFYQPPVSQQPPIQIPFSDPFQHRAADPFMPNAPQRRDSYGVQSGRDAASAAHSERAAGGNMWPSTSGPPASNTTPSHLAHSAPPPPPPPVASSSHSSANSTPYAYESSRRRSIGRQSPPRSYYAPASQEPQQSTPFASRQMPPPSPSQQQLHPTGYAPQRPPPFSGGRELPGLGSHRPGGGMSISSILGTDTSSQPQPPRPQHSPPTTQSPSTPGMRPPSPRRGQSAGSRVELNQQWRRPQTPEKHPVPSALRMAENPAYAAESSPRYYGQGQGPRGSPEYSRNVPAQQQQPQQQHYHSHPTPPRSSHAYHRSSPTNSAEHRPAEDRIPPRPTSQPAAHAQAAREGEHRDLAGHGQMQPHYGGHAPERNHGQEDPRSQPSFVDRHHHAVSSGERAVTVQPVTRAAYTPPRDQRQDGNNLLHRNLLGREPVREEPNRDYGAARREDSSAPFRTGFRGQYYNQPPKSAPPGEAPRSHPQPVDHFRRAPDATQFGGQDTPHGFGRLLPQHSSDHQGAEKRRDDMAYGGGDPRSQNSLYDTHPRGPGGEEMQQSRSLLGISSDPNRRGRASPLPQAVQGAQAQLIGPGTDPHVKSEFGRLFQGLGSGLGGPGNLTPSRQSPVPQRMRDDMNSTGPAEVDGVRMTRVVSGSGRGRGRRVKDETPTAEIGHDGRGAPAGTGGRGKRGKGVVHHHHVRPAHHHHVHKNEESPALQPTNTTASQSAAVTQSAHHHHHIHPASHHHHHHPPRQSIPVINIPKPTLKIGSQTVLDAVKHKPRNHLGNALYAVKVTTPPMASTPLHDRYGYFMQYKAARRFTSADENCTFTIRVPRDFLTAESREKLCVDRYLYGTEVFTEDSDPIVAAIHSGWIRGDWGPDVDESLIDLPPPIPEDQAIPTEMTEVPKSPIVPPPNKDAHIKILILPPLLKYSSTLRFGVRSRKWGDNHDGVSFMIHSVRWVDEGLNGGHERRGPGRKKRMRAEVEGREYPMKRTGVESSRLIGVAAA